MHSDFHRDNHNYFMITLVKQFWDKILIQKLAMKNSLSDHSAIIRNCISIFVATLLY